MKNRQIPFLPILSLSDPVLKFFFSAANLPVGVDDKTGAQTPTREKRHDDPQTFRHIDLHQIIVNNIE